MLSLFAEAVTFDPSSITELGVIGVVLVAVVLFMRSYITKMDEHQNTMIATLMDLLQRQTDVMGGLRDSITELSTLIKREKGDMHDLDSGKGGGT